MGRQKNMASNRLFRFPILLLTLIALPCCSGGSRGTGTIIVEGRISVEATASPASGIQVTDTNTGNTSVTDSNGAFSLEASGDQTSVSLQVESTPQSEVAVNGTVSITHDSGDDSALAVDIAIDSNANPIVIGDVQVRAKVVGECDLYFENGRVIRQANAAPDGIECTAKAEIRKDGIGIGDVPFIMQVRACPGDSAWTTIGEGTTRSDQYLGNGQIEFNFFNDFENCVYRIIAPFNADGLPETVHEIHTFTKQSFDDGKIEAP